MRAPTAAVAVALVLGGCGLFSDDGPDVVVVGDSVTQMSTAEIVGTVDDDVEVRALLGYRTDELVGEARDGADEDPRAMVVVTGYNDLLQDNVESPALAEMVEAVADVPCVIWVLLHTEGDWPVERAQRWNTRVEEAVADRPTMHVTTEWRDLVDGTPEGTYLIEDRVHPAPPGREALAAVVDRAIGRECPIES